MKPYPKSTRFCLAVTALFSTLHLVACGDDDDFTPVSRNRGYDYALKSTKEFADYPCNDVREGREAVVGRDKDSYYCEFDSRDSVYIWVGDTDTLTAEGREFHRAESSSSVTPQNVTLSEVEGSSDSETSVSSSSYRSSSSYSSSYSSSSYRSSSSYSRDVPFNPDTDYGSMTDTRDGKTYKTVVVNGQTWMAENLNYAGNNVGIAICYGENDSLCAQYGRLYSRDAAMDDSRCEFLADCGLGDGPIQGICPDGWHIPTLEEMQNLIGFIGDDVSHYKSTESTWTYDDGVDTYGLSFLGAGNWSSKNGFEDLHRYEVTWAYYPNGYQYYLLLGGPSGIVSVGGYNTNEYYSSVRCIKGDGIPTYSSSSVKSSSSYSRIKQENAEPFLDEAGTQFNPEIDYGTMTDPRDNKTYKTVDVKGKIWMAENLNYAGNEIGVSTCFNDEDRFCDFFGRLYNRDAAMNDASCAFGDFCDLGDGPIQGICPSGWHIPTNIEAQDLVNVANGNGTPLMSAKGWSVNSGTDTYGLSFMGSGCYTTSEGFHSMGVYEHTWVYYVSSYQYYIVIRGAKNESEVWNYGTNEVYNSIRCVKD
jgi:uncharacterized protein (TIGR02145 family)